MSIKQLRINKGLSQEKLALQSGLSSRTIQRIEKENHASLESLNALAKAFEMELDELKNAMHKDETQQNKPKKDLLQDKKIQSFLIINLMLFAINIITTPEYLWFIFPLLGWGIPLTLKRVLNK